MAAIKINYNTLVSSPESLQADIQKAFGNGDDALGAIIIEGEHGKPYKYCLPYCSKWRG